MPELREQLHAALSMAYTLEHEIGGGGMSRVFVADEFALGRKVVVKVIAPELMEGVSVERFTREVKLAARLQQANIVPVLAAGTAMGMPYYTMPFVDGLSLRARMAQGALPIAEAVGILRDVARALAYAHGQGVVHRDIKPENILLSGGAAVVTDFGIAKALSASRTQEASEAGLTVTALTRAGMSLGTPAYMAPEQAAGDPNIDHRADLYAWGVVAWELVAGAHPFAGCTTPHALIAAHMTEAPAPLGERRPDVPPAVAALVTRCLEKSPDRRPASAGELLEALDAMSTPGNAQPVAPRAPRQWALAVAAIAALAIVVAGAVMIARRSGGPAAAVAGPSVAASAKSLAVLPFASVGSDTSNLYFAEGIADELTTALARLPGLRLAGRASSARLKQRGASAQEIGSALTVSAVLDGTVRRAGDRIRVSAELTSTDDGHVLWKDSYQRELKDVFAVQDDITRAIVEALQIQLAGGQSPIDTSAHGTSNLAAYDLYLRGLQLYRKRGASLAESERYLTEAIALDSNFARAYAMLASVLIVTPYYFDTSMESVLPRARAAAERAVALDDALPAAHLALGHVHVEAFEWKEAEAELRRAMALDPNNGEIAYRLGVVLLTSGRVRESIDPFERARTTDPLYPLPRMYLAWAMVIAGRTREALAEARRADEIDPTSEAGKAIYANILLATGQRDEAVALARKMVPRAANLRRLGYYGHVLGTAGERDDARRILRGVEATPAGASGRSSALTYLYLGLGDTSRALDALERAAATGGDLVLSGMVSSSFFDVVRASPRFAAAMRHFNLDVARLTAPDGGRSR